MSEVSGRRMILEKIWEVDATITKDDAVTDSIIKRLKELEHEGYQFEGAESTFELVIRKQLGKYRPFFSLEHFRIIGEHPTTSDYGSSAIIKVKVDGAEEITAAEGDGPVHALDRALRKALDRFYPELSNVHLTDYKVRVINGKDATASKVRVLIQSTDGDSVWTTVGVVDRHHRGELDRARRFDRVQAFEARRGEGGQGRSLAGRQGRQKVVSGRPAVVAAWVLAFPAGLARMAVQSVLRRRFSWPPALRAALRRAGTPTSRKSLSGCSA